MYRVSVVVGTNEAIDQTIYNFGIDGKPFAAVVSTGADLAVHFYSGHNFRPNEAIYLLNAAMVQFDLLDAWSDAEFTLPSDGMR